MSGPLLVLTLYVVSSWQYLPPPPDRRGSWRMELHDFRVRYGRPPASRQSGTTTCSTSSGMEGLPAVLHPMMRPSSIWLVVRWRFTSVDLNHITMTFVLDPKVCRPSPARASMCTTCVSTLEGGARLAVPPQSSA